MPMENQLAHAITQTEYDLSYDKAAKKLLANKQILAQIIHELRVWENPKSVLYLGLYTSN